MKILGKPVKIGMTWDDLQPLLDLGLRESLSYPDTATWRAQYRFPSGELIGFILSRGENTPYILVDVF
jgi:hypothetical protein